MRGWDTLPSKLPAQIALFSLLFFGTMIYWHWEAMLISFLATRVISLPFKDIPDLVANTEFRIILRPGTSFEDAFKTSPDPIWQAAWTYRIEPHLDELGFDLDPDRPQLDFSDKVTKDGLTAWYHDYLSVM